MICIFVCFWTSTPNPKIQNSFYVINLGFMRDNFIPEIEYFTQEKIAALIEESFNLKNQSGQLLETAKRAVEIAVEEDEAAAIRFIEEA